MGQGFLRISGPEETAEPVIGANSVVFAVGSPVTLDSSGFLALSAAGDKVYGYCVEEITMASDNQTVAKYQPAVVLPDNVVAWFDADQDATQTDIGAYADIASVSAGIATLNLAAGSSGQFIVLSIDPYGDGDNSIVAVKVAEPQVLAFAQA